MITRILQKIRCGWDIIGATVLWKGGEKRRAGAEENW